MRLVLDASVTLAWHFEDESTSQVREVLTRVVEEGALVPGLWRFEVANGLQSAVRRKRIDNAYRDRALANLPALDIRVGPESDSQAWSATLQLATLHRLTIYDAAYLEVSRRRRLPLASLDEALRQAASACGVSLIA